LLAPHKSTSFPTNIAKTVGIAKPNISEKVTAFSGRSSYSWMNWTPYTGGTYHNAPMPAVPSEPINRANLWSLHSSFNGPTLSQAGAADAPSIWAASFFAACSFRSSSKSGVSSK